MKHDQAQGAGLRDDLDGTGGARPVRFTFDGTAYRINLSHHNAERMRQALAPFIIAARRLGRTHGRRRAR